MNDLVDWEDKLESLAKTESNVEEKQITMPYISSAGGRFSFQKSELPNPMSVIVLDALFDNAFYEQAYVPGKYQAPVCFAMNKVRDEMQPHELAPKKQDDYCITCAKNQFGSSKTGGKACRNYRRLLVLSTNDLDDLDAAENKLALMNVSPTSMSMYSKYAFYVANSMKRPIFSVITSIKLAPVEGKMYTSFHFTLEGNVATEHLQGLLDMRDRNQNLLTLPYPVQKIETKDQEAIDEEAF